MHYAVVGMMLLTCLSIVYSHSFVQILSTRAIFLSLVRFLIRNQLELSIFFKFFFI